MWDLRFGERGAYLPQQFPLVGDGIDLRILKHTRDIQLWVSPRISIVFPRVTSPGLGLSQMDVNNTYRRQSFGCGVRKVGFASVCGTRGVVLREGGSRVRGVGEEGVKFEPERIFGPGGCLASCGSERASLWPIAAI